MTQAPPRPPRAATDTPRLRDGGREAPSHPVGVALFLRLFFFLVRRAPWFPRLVRPLAVRATVWVSGTIRRGTGRNARRIYGRDLSRRERGRFARGVVGSFYDFCVDVGRGLPASSWRGRVAGVEGRDAYDACRRGGTGAILVTLHMGSFEAGLAALRSVEPRVSVVFLRDPFADFETARADLRQSLGVRELALDDGYDALTKIPHALRRNEVVVMQGDRAYPGQRSRVVPFLHGHLRLPLGPARLARMCGSPIVPVASVRRPDGRFDVHLGPPVEVGDDDGAAVRAVAAVFESWVRRWPTQWLALRPAFCEDGDALFVPRS